MKLFISISLHIPLTYTTRQPIRADSLETSLPMTLRILIQTTALIEVPFQTFKFFFLFPLIDDWIMDALSNSYISHFMITNLKLKREFWNIPPLETVESSREWETRHETEAENGRESLHDSWKYAVQKFNVWQEETDGVKLKEVASWNWQEIGRSRESQREWSSAVVTISSISLFKS